MLPVHLHDTDLDEVSGRALFWRERLDRSRRGTSDRREARRKLAETSRHVRLIAEHEGVSLTPSMLETLAAHEPSTGSTRRSRRTVRTRASSSGRRMSILDGRATSILDGNVFPITMLVGIVLGLGALMWHAEPDPASVPHTATAGELERLRECQTGGDYAYTNGEQYGAYEFLQMYWERYGGEGRPNRATPEEQDRIAARVIADGKGNLWTCDHVLGSR